MFGSLGTSATQPGPAIEIVPEGNLGLELVKEVGAQISDVLPNDGPAPRGGHRTVSFPSSWSLFSCDCTHAEVFNRETGQRLMYTNIPGALPGWQEVQLPRR